MLLVRGVGYTEDAAEGCEGFYGPEAYFMHLTDRCRFLNCSVRMGERYVMNS
jgi:hypothetical protein